MGAGTGVVSERLGWDIDHCGSSDTLDMLSVDVLENACLDLTKVFCWSDLT